MTHTLSILSTSPFTISVGKINVFSACQGCAGMIQTHKNRDVILEMHTRSHTGCMCTWTHITMFQRPSAVLKTSFFPPNSVLTDVRGAMISITEKREAGNTLIIKRVEKRKGCMLGKWPNEREHGRSHDLLLEEQLKEWDHLWSRTKHLELF